MLLAYITVLKTVHYEALKRKYEELLLEVLKTLESNNVPSWHRLDVVNNTIN